MNFRQLEAFREVMRCGTVSRAAEIMGITQPAVSRSIAELEAAVDFPLFDRVKGRLVVTPEGQSFFRDVDASFVGLDRLRAAAADVILMNPQYAPKVITKPNAEGMVDLIDAAARATRVDLFQRYAVMRYWRLTENIPFEAFLSPDGLHLNDWSYSCVAKLLADAIAEAAQRPTLTAGASAR